MGFLPDDSPVLETKVATAEDPLIKSIEGKVDHVLCRLFPPTIKRHYSLDALPSPRC